MEEEEKKTQASLDEFKSQLSQVDQALQAGDDSEDLRQLKNNLEEVIALTEDHLLDVKKALLAKDIGLLSDFPRTENNTSTSPATEEDDEYAAFKAAVGESSAYSSASQEPSSGATEDRSDSVCVPESDKEKLNTLTDMANLEDAKAIHDNLMELIGTKCRAPFSTDWGHLHYCNAMINSVEYPDLDDDLNDQKVNVMFINPTHQAMVPCKWYMNGTCNYTNELCRYSHGHPVNISELQAFIEPDYSKIVEGCRCLAKKTDEIWYQANVLEVCSIHEVHIQFDNSNESHSVKLEHIVPLEDESDTDSSDNDDSNDDKEEAEMPSAPYSTSNINNDDSDEESELPVYLWKPSKTTEKLGAWESHTRGIGSKLMAKMGYVTGQGLGPNGEGRAEPVPILLLPQGKSLDKIMKLKEMSGNADLFNAMKKLEKRQKILEKKEAEKEKKRKKRENVGVFGFLNDKLAGGKGCLREHVAGPSTSFSSSSMPPSKEKVKQSNEKELNKRSDLEVNLQIFKTADEIKNVERQLGHLRQQLSRNESRDRKMADNVRQKIAEQESYLCKLRNSSTTLETHKARRTAHKKLTIF